MTPRNPGPPVTFVVPGDLHLTEPGLPNHRAALRMIGEVNGVIRPDFVQFIGDNVQDATEDQFRLFDDLRNRLEVPHFALVGDHDIHDDPGVRGFRSRLGSTYGSWSLRGFRLIRLDTQEVGGFGLSDGQIGWFRGEVDTALASGERVILFQHNYPYQIWEDFAGPGVDAWREVVQTRRVSAIVCGHTHYEQVANDGRNVTVAVRSIGDPEGGEPGYLVGFASGDDLAAAYREIGRRDPLVLITHPRETIFATGPRHVVAGPDEVRVRLWSARYVREVRGRIDGGPWQGLVAIGDDEWSMPLAGDALSKGEHTCEVEAVDEQGQVGHRRMGFVSDPTGRFTAVPGVRPVVTRTSFC